MTDLVLVTGGAGTLARVVTPGLIEAGYGVRLFDVRAIDDPPGGVDGRVGDLRDRSAVRSAMTGVRGVIHAAAWHGIHLGGHPRDDFWDLNVRGTYHVYEAAAEAGVKAVVCSSTMGVYGESRIPADGDPAKRIGEDLGRTPADIYGLSKVIAEDLSEGYSRMAGIAGVSLRYGMFVPEPFHRAGIRFLYGGVDERDVARANILALRRLLEAGGHLGALNVFSELPFRADDGHDLRRDPLVAIGRYWPDAPALLDAAGVKPWGPINEVYETGRAEKTLGFRPRYGFAQYLEALRAGRDTL
ncbi:MAG TPA: NAD(P)-dependent oxidoreductase [Patescibacteria group bacterium]|nr:NAD(P)-dependent oxidoreductase [Patescibacteria group bacterium]